MDNSVIDIPGRIFICYRRKAAAFPAALIYDGLRDEFGPENVFKDVNSIRPGENFVRTLVNEVRGCEMLLAVITTDWTTVVDAAGRVRLDDPHDYVRMEIETALRSGMPIIPVLVGGAHMPHLHELPESLASLAQLQACEIDERNPNRDLDSLVTYVKQFRQEIAKGQSTTVISPPPAGAGSQPAPETARPPLDNSSFWASPKPVAAAAAPALRRGRYRRLTIVAAAVVSASALTLVLLNTAQSQDTVVTPGPTPAPTNRQSASPKVGPHIPQAADPLSVNAMIVRRSTGSNETEIVSLSSKGQVVKTLVPASGDNVVGTVMSPDRRTFLYIRRADAKTELHARATDGSGDDIILFSAKGKGNCPYIRRPAWSGKLLAVPCGLENADNGPAALRVMSLDGQVIQTLDSGYLGDPTFVANGSTVVYWLADHAHSYSGGTLYTIATDLSTGREALTAPDGADADPAASPLGDLVVYRHRNRAGDMQLNTINVASRKASALTKGPLDRDPSFSPDGLKVAFKRGHAATAQPWIVSVNHVEKNHAILEDAGGYGAPSWTAR